jgi:hypothetical protein
VAVPLNNNDAIYAEIRDLSIERLGAYLQDKAIHIRERCEAYFIICAVVGCILFRTHDCTFGEMFTMADHHSPMKLQCPVSRSHSPVYPRVDRYTTFRDNKDASITEIHDFVKKIPKLTLEYKSLNQHINIAEMLKQRTDR